MNFKRLKRHKATARMTAAQTACFIGTPLAISYAVIYIAATLCAWAVGDDALSETIQVFITAHLQTQLPLLLLLAIALFICVLTNSLEFGAIWGALPGTTALQNFLLGLSEKLQDLGSAKRSGILILAAPTASIPTSRASPPPRLATGWAPSTHPTLTYG